MVDEKRNLKSCLIKETTNNLSKVWEVIKNIKDSVKDVVSAICVLVILVVIFVGPICILTYIFPKGDIIPLLLSIYIEMPIFVWLISSLQEDKPSIKMLINIFIWWNILIIKIPIYLMIASLNLDIAILLSIGSFCLLINNIVLASIISVIVFILSATFNIALFKCLRLQSILEGFDFEPKEYWV